MVADKLKNIGKYALLNPVFIDVAAFFPTSFVKDRYAVGITPDGIKSDSKHKSKLIKS